VSDKLLNDRLNVTPSERVAIVTLALAQGKELEPEQVAEMTECDLSTAYRVLQRISRVIPLYGDEATGRWSLVRDSLNFVVE